MQLRNVGVILLILLLAEMAMAVMVSATENDTVFIDGEDIISSDTASASGSLDMIESNYVSVKTAKKQAIEALAENIILEDLGNAVDFNGANVNGTPLVVFDMNGKRLFYQFWVEQNGIRIGEIKIAASKALGSPVQALGTSSPEEYNRSALVTEAKSIISESYPGYRINSTRVVSYDYPLTGLMVEAKNPNTQAVTKFIVDSNDMGYIVISGGNQSIAGDTSTPLEFDTVQSSSYDSMSQNEMQSNIAIWNEENSRINSINEKIASAYNTTTTENLTTAISSGELNGNNGAVKTSMTAGLKSSTPRILMSNFPVTNQGKRDWCMIATAWAITKYYYLTYKKMDNGNPVPGVRSLSLIGKKMGASGYNGAKGWYEEQQYYRDPWSTTWQGGLGLSHFLYYAWAPSMGDITEQINNGDPLKIGTKMSYKIIKNGVTYTIPNGHARACYGYDTTHPNNPRIYFSDSALVKRYWEVYQAKHFGNHIKIKTT